MRVGPEVAASVLSILVIPITAVRSLGLTTAAMNAERGVWSREFNPVLIKSRMTVIGTNVREQ